MPEDQNHCSVGIRKGTFSCRECKRRKKRCELSPGASSCLSCQRHGVVCTSQYTPDAGSMASSRIEELEKQVHQLLHPTRGRNSQRPVTPTLRSVNHERLSRHGSLNGYLYSILPHPDLVLKIFGSSDHFKPQCQEPDLGPTAHPVLLARRLVQIALCLDQLNAETCRQLNHHSRVRDARDYFEVASRLVLSQDYLVASQDGLETLLLQGRYHVAIGDIKSAWLVQRRASRIGYTIGLPRLAETAGGQPESVWFRNIYTDRFLSLMLGLPCEAVDNRFATTERLATVSPELRLERIHVLVAGQIIARNLRMQCGQTLQEQQTSDKEYGETEKIDNQLKKASRILPTTWWVPSSLGHISSDSEVSEQTTKILLQMHQYYLLVLLHQPYLIQRFCLGFGGSGRRYTYCALAAAAASREVVVRFLLLRNYNRSPSFRTIDDKCFIGATTLLIAHIDGHRLDSANVLEHQRSHDLGLVERAIDLMEDLSTADNDKGRRSHVESLRRLLQIEANAVDGSICQAWNEPDAVGNFAEGSLDGQNTIMLSIPYFGGIYIAQEQPHSQLELCNPDTDLVQTPVNYGALAVLEDVHADPFSVFASELQKQITRGHQDEILTGQSNTLSFEGNTTWFDNWIQEKV